MTIVVEPQGKRYPTLPNCDGCGRFTSTPSEVSGCNALGHLIACYLLLLCPKCAAKESAE